MKILQGNIDRGIAAWDIMNSTIKNQAIDICVVAEPNKRAIEAAKWFKDLNNDAGIKVNNIKIKVLHRGKDYLNQRYVTRGKTKTAIRAGVPQGSILDPTLWNVLYDGVLRLPTPEGVGIIGSADDLAIVVTASETQYLTRRVNNSIELVKNWMAEHALKIAPEKSEAIILRSRGRPGERKNGEVGPATAQYSKKRAMLYGAVQSIVLYGAPVWSPALNINKYRRELERTQRGGLLRVASAYRTASTVALQIITGVIPLDLLVLERKYVHDHAGEDDLATVKLRAREVSLVEWQHRWDGNRDKAQ
ncbi:hypothetical protein ILUMI_03404 [Ignelater luminosus]|uniref:Reverse transcriptase domain-containing protein n=1 Tax=Ignelater luminosus TaxID=2038154 RepID=A0A8K0GKH2_IGNLU|nr:hypothetical protein ILUMI_03404 [Ignelater luminosus]